MAYDRTQKSLKKKKIQKERKKDTRKLKRDSEAFGVSEMFRRDVNRCERKREQSSLEENKIERGKLAFVEVMPFRGFRFSLSSLQLYKKIYRFYHYIVFCTNLIFKLSLT